jgi:hypothetical protein
MSRSHGGAAALGLAALGALVYVLWLGARDLWYPGEPDLAEICRAMFTSGDWVIPRRNGEIFLNYGPLFFWAGSLSAHLLGGMSEFSLRLPNALAAIGLVVATSLVGTRWFGPRAGLWAGLLLLASWEFSWQAIGFRVDVLFALFVGLGIFAYASGAGPDARWAPRVAGFALLGLAVLVKGPLGLLLPGLVLTLWHAGRREWRAILELAPLALVAIAVALPWYIASAISLGTETVIREFVSELQPIRERRAGSRTGRLLLHLEDLARSHAVAALLPSRSGGSSDQGVAGPPRPARALVVRNLLRFLSIAAPSASSTSSRLPGGVLLLARWIAALERARRRPSPDPRPARVFAAGFGSSSRPSPSRRSRPLPRSGWSSAGSTSWRRLASPPRLRLPRSRCRRCGGPVALGRPFEAARISTTLRRLASPTSFCTCPSSPGSFPPRPAQHLCTAPPLDRGSDRVGGHLGYMGSDHAVGAFGYYTGKRMDRVERGRDRGLLPGAPRISRHRRGEEERGALCQREGRLVRPGGA